jgi:hypothetical protein
MDVTTRWNSTLAMLERLCEQQSAIIALPMTIPFQKLLLQQ